MKKAFAQEPVAGGRMDEAAHMEMLRRERISNSAWKKFSHNKGAMVGLVIISFMLAVAVLAPILAPNDPDEMNILGAYLAPGEQGYILGTDDFGRCLLSRLIYGARMSVIVAAGSTILGGTIGVLLGLIAGWKGGIVDSVIMRVMDGMFAFPFILLSIILVTILGPGVKNVILAIGIVSIPKFARIVCGEVLVLKNLEYVNAERVLGASNARIMFSHIFPNTLSSVLVYSTLNIAEAILNEAALSFLGLGILTPAASWGNILRTGKGCLENAPQIAMSSGVCIFVIVIGFNLLGDGIRDVLDPKKKR